MENIGEDADRLASRPETEPSDPVSRSARSQGDDEERVIRPSFPAWGPGPVSAPAPSLPPATPPAAAAATEIFAGDQIRVPPPRPVTRLRAHYSWVPGNVSPPPWQCQVCPALFAAVDALATHFHQYHLNPHHLSQEDRRKYRLSNFLVNTNEEAEFKTEFPGLYRCHECFNVFSFPVSLREHLLAHSQPPAMVMSKIPSKFSREDFEDVSPRKRSRRSYKENNFEENQDIRKPEKINNNLNRHKRVRTRLKSNTKITEINSDPSDEYNSDSDFDGDKISIEKQKAKGNFRDSKRRRVSSKRFSLNGLSEVDYTKAFLDPDEELDIEKKAKKTKARNVKRNSTKNKKQSSLKQNPETFPNDIQISWHENKEASMKTKEVTKVARRSQKQEKKWRFKIIDHSKHHSVVQHLTTPSQDFICLSCNQSFSSYTCLSQHRIICEKRKKFLWINNDACSRRQHDVKEEIVNNCSEEIFQYVTGAVTTIPETTFNNMHGKIADLNTEDAQKLSRNHLNEIGLVKLNFSGNWSVKDVWESGCWEPKEDQLTWQDYELSSEIFKSKNETQGVSDTDKTEADQAAPEPDNDEVHKLTEKLTTQIVGRKAPIITNPAMDRQMVMAMSKMHWTEQKYIKQRIDTNLTTKRNKRLSVGGESIRQSNITSILDLKQTGKSVKYMKQAERESLSKPLIGEEGRVEGSLSGEWELGHSYMCSVCGVEYDDMMEILHHKWEAHPRCLVSHFSVRDNVTKPSDLMYPQVGPSTVKREAENSDSRTTVLQKCSKCQMEFIKNEDFYHHILECGGVDDLVETRKKKKKKKRMGGGLKSTVRMLKQADNHQEGTDTGDEQSPKKKPRPPPKVVQPVPLIPTHTRTTRYKETMKKEAKKIAAKERRIKKKGTRKSRGELTEQRRIVAEVLDKVLSDVEKIRRKSSKIRAKSKPGISSKEEVQSNSSMETVQLNNLKRGKIKSNHRTGDRVFNSRIGRIRREAKVKTYKEDSSDSEPSTEQREDENSENFDAAIESEALAAPKTVLVTVVNDEILSTLTDIEKMREEPTDAVSGAEVPLPSPGGVKINENSPRILKRLMSTLVSDAQVTALGNGVEEQAKHRSRQQFSVETKMTAISRIEAGERQVDIARDLDIGVSVLESWWIRKSDIRSNYVNKLANGLHDEDFLGKKAPQKAKSLALKTIPVGVKAEAIESVGRGQSPGKVAKELGVSPSQVSFWIRRKDKILKRHRNNSLSDPISIDAGDEQTETSKKSYSLQFKKRVIERISAGEEISAVAKKLKIRENTVAVWWIRKDQILRRQDDFISNTNSSLETKDDYTVAPPVAPEPQEQVLDAFTSDTAVNGIFEGAGKDFKKTDPEEEDPERLERQPRSRRSVSSGTRVAGSVLTSRWCMPLEVKQTALRRLEAGLTQAVVARDLGVSLSTVASWWRKKDSILGVISINTESEDCLNSPSESNTFSSDIQEQNLSHDLPHDAETNKPAEIEEEVMSSPTKEPTSQIDDLGILELEQLMTDESEAEMKSGNDFPTRDTNLEDNDETEKPDPNGSENQEETSDEEKNSDLDDLDVDDARIPEALSLTPRPRSVISLTSTPRPQSGLHLIVSSYCSSSDDEL